MKLKLQYIIIYYIILSFELYAQCTNCSSPTTANCFDVTSGNSRFILDGKTNYDFTFDELTEYARGITYVGQTTLKLTVGEQTAGACKWKLVMYIDNNNTLPANEWEPLVYYGNSGTNPQLNLIQVAVYNGCGTPIANGVYQIFAGNTNCDQIDIIPALPVQNLPGACNGTQVNGPGSYLTNYNEFIFHIDFRIIPGFQLRPGSYQIRIRFCLVEVP